MKDQIKLAVTPTQLETARKQLANKGLAIFGNSGTIKEKGVTVMYSYDTPTETLTLTLEKIAFWVPLSAAYLRKQLLAICEAEGIKEKV